MKRLATIINTAATLLLLVMFSSCGVKKTQVIPTAISSVTNPITLDNLNLTKDSYQILKTETVESVIVYEETGLGATKTIKISEQNHEYSLEFKKNDNTGGYDIKYSGIVKFGYLTQYDSTLDYNVPAPALYGRGLAAYRLINAVQSQGADGIIEPIVTMKVGQEGKKVIFTTTLSAKLVKIKTK